MAPEPGHQTNGKSVYKLTSNILIRTMTLVQFGFLLFCRRHGTICEIKCSNVNVIVEQIESVALCFCLNCTRRYCFVHLCSFMTDFITSPLSLNVHLHVYCLLCSVVSFVLCRLDRCIQCILLGHLSKLR